MNALMAQTPAFPGAEGAGRNTVGGRGGVVYEVTNLDDSGPGSLREAVEAYGPRTVVFRVSGIIRLESYLKIKNGYITIAGQTAPGDGICIRDYPVSIQAIEVIIRYVRFRLGDVMGEVIGENSDSIGGRNLRKIVIDHCSASWSMDEAMSLYGIDSLTIQWCLISESLYFSKHPKGAHGYGGIWGGRNASFHHNLFAHHSSRTPRFAGGSTARCENVDYRNNVIYIWGFNSAYGGEDGTINMVANYYKAGPATKNSVRNRIIQPYDPDGKWYVEENIIEGNPDISTNNWAGGVQGSYASENLVRAYTPFPFVPITSQSAEDAYALVLEGAGASFPARDAVDARIIQEVITGTATYDGTQYEIDRGYSDTSVNRGIIDSQDDVGGWPDLQSLEAPIDSDHDGMPDDWELANNLNPSDPADRNILDPEGFTMLEVYLNSLVDPTSSIPETNPLPVTFRLEQNYPNPFNPRTTIRLMIPERGRVDVVVYNVQGVIINRLLAEYRPAGSIDVQWNGLDENGIPAVSGIYFCVVKYRNIAKTIKMNLIR